MDLNVDLQMRYTVQIKKKKKRKRRRTCGRICRRSRESLNLNKDVTKGVFLYGHVFKDQIICLVFRVFLRTCF